jgi:hypothetical protein
MMSDRGVRADQGPAVTDLATWPPSLYEPRTAQMVRPCRGRGSHNRRLILYGQIWGLSVDFEGYCAGEGLTYSLKHGALAGRRVLRC